jgi:hypothetical protein
MVAVVFTGHFASSGTAEEISSEDELRRFRNVDQLQLKPSMPQNNIYK